MTDTDSPDAVAETSTPVPAPAHRFGIASIVIATLFGLLYVYDLWEAVSNLVQLPVVYEAYGLDMATFPWWLLLVGVAIPPVVFGLALAAGRRQSVGVRALLLLLGLAVVAAASLGVIAAEIALRLK
jgi:hypothetical protein